MQVCFTLNGQPHRADVPAERLLVHYLREDLGLTGTHIGCDTSQCGACNLLIDGESAKACTTLVGQLEGAQVISIEGLATPPSPQSPAREPVLHPMQQAFRDCHGLQCGFCTPGMVLTGIAMAQRHQGDLTRETIIRELEGNLCRCTGYIHIVDAIAQGTQAMRDAGLIQPFETGADEAAERQPALAAETGVAPHAHPKADA